MLTIGQLAAHVGVTIRAVRHYHRCGLLAEPDRDASGYRRYDAQAVVDLIRVKVLADAGVPLARVHELLHATPAEFGAAIGDIDRALQRKAKEIAQHRRRITELTAGERLFLPAEVVAVLDRERALGFSERIIQIERDAWILVAALSPAAIAEFVRVKSLALDDADFVDLYLACDRAYDWDPADPRLLALAETMVTWAASKRADSDDEGDPAAVMLMLERVVDASPAWRRLYQLTERLSG